MINRSNTQDTTTRLYQTVQLKTCSSIPNDRAPSWSWRHYFGERRTGNKNFIQAYCVQAVTSGYKRWYMTHVRLMDARYDDGGTITWMWEAVFILRT